MKKITKQFKFTKLALLLLLVLAAGALKAQPTVFVTSKDYDGNGVLDQLWYGPNAYVYIKHGGTGVWTSYYMGPTFSFPNSGIDLDGVAGAEIAVWHPSSESMIVITDRTKTTKPYYLGSTGINSWVQCTNSFTNLDGVAGAEIMINYYNRSAASHKGLMIIHRTKTTRSTWTCFNLSSRQSGAGGAEYLEVPNTAPETNAFIFDENTASPAEVIRFKTTPYFNQAPVKNTLSISPNPTTGLVNIQVGKADERISTVTITDAQGKVVFTSSNGSKRIDLSHLSAGLYFYRIQSSESTITGKLIKQ